MIGLFNLNQLFSSFVFITSSAQCMGEAFGRTQNPPEEVMTSGPGTIIINQVTDAFYASRCSGFGAGSSPSGGCCGGSNPPMSLCGRAFACVRLVCPFGRPPSCKPGGVRTPPTQRKVLTPMEFGRKSSSEAKVLPSRQAKNPGTARWPGVVRA